MDVIIKFEIGTIKFEWIIQVCNFDVYLICTKIHASGNSHWDISIFPSADINYTMPCEGLLRTWNEKKTWTITLKKNHTENTFNKIEISL